MKKLLILLSIAIVACTDQNDVSISGTIKGGEGTKLYLQQLETSRLTDLDSVTLKDSESFKFKLNLENPELLLLKNHKGEIINLLPAPGENLRVNADLESFQDYDVEGSTDSEKIRGLVQQLGATRHRLDSISLAISNLSDGEEQKLNILQNAYRQSYIDQKRYNIRYIVENITSLSSVYALYQKLYDDLYVMNDYGDLTYFKFVADSMKLHYPASSLTLSLLDDITAREQDFENSKHLEELLSVAEVESLLDVAIPDTNGDTIALSDIKDKVVMLVFWSSLDATSTQALIKLQSTYKKYHKMGFEVYAVSLDNQKAPWLSSINYNQFSWINVSELSYPNSRADRLYNITRIPSNFLINKEGELVMKDIYGRNLEIWLDNLL